MKVLHINWSGNFGGAEHLAYELVSHFVGAGLKPAPTLAYMSEKSFFGARAECEGIRVVEFNMRSGFDVFRFMRYILFIMSEKFDIIHDHNGGPLVRLSKVFSPGSIFIQHIHGPKISPECWESLRVLLWKHFTSRLVDHYIANSKYTKRMAIMKEKIPLSLISVVYNGIDIDKFVEAGLKPASTIRNELGIKEDEWVVGTVGSLTEAKGIDKFIQVAEKVRDAKFVIVGDGELRSGLESLVKSKELVDRVIFAGRREDIPSVLKSFDVFLLTSNWESFGISLVEAMAVGVPVVAFRVGGVPEVVCKEYSFLVSDIKRAAESILFLMAHPEVAKKMGVAGVRWVKDIFNINKTAKEVESIYRGFVK